MGNLSSYSHSCSSSEIFWISFSWNTFLQRFVLLLFELNPFKILGLWTPLWSQAKKSSQFAVQGSGEQTSPCVRAMENWGYLSSLHPIRRHATFSSSTKGNALMIVDACDGQAPFLLLRMGMWVKTVGAWAKPDRNRFLTAWIYECSQCKWELIVLGV